MNFIINWTYRLKNGMTTTFVSQRMSANETLLFAEDIEKTGRMKQLEIIDEYDTSWTIKSLKKFLKELETEPHNTSIYFDGNYNKEEKLAGLGIVIYYSKNGENYRMRKNALFEYIESNNEAEYAALSFAIKECVELGIVNQQVKVYGDSQVVINQMSDEWAMYEEDLMRWADEIDTLCSKHQLSLSFQHIERNENKEADQLAKQALQNNIIEATVKR